MRHLAPTVALFLACTFSVASAETTLQTFPLGVPPGTDPLTGARPGNEIGTGNSLPKSDKASNITEADTRSVLAPNLPSPPLGENASSRDYLAAARGALAAGHTGEAQQALEMAETRALDRSVPLFQTTAPIKDPLVAEIEDALHTLSAGDRLRSMRIIEASIVRLESATHR
jgi:hypothetical protein